MRPRCEQPPSPACAGFAVASARLPRWADPTPRSVPRQSPKAVVLAGFYPRSHLPDLVIPCICPSTMPMWIGGEAQAEAASSSCSCRSGPDDFRSELPPAQAQVVIWYSLRPRHRLLFGTVKEKPHSTCTLLIGATTHGRLRFRLGLVREFWEFGYCSTFVFIWQLLFNHRLIRLKMFVS